VKPEFADGSHALEQAVTACWREVLKSALVTPEDNFFDLGGASVQVIELYSKLRVRLPEQSFEIVALFQYPTIRSFVEFLCPIQRNYPAADTVRPTGGQWTSMSGNVAQGLTPEERIARQKRVQESMNPKIRN